MTSMNGRTVLVTGATDGIGRQTALDLAGMGASVIIHGRDQKRLQEARAEITKATGNHEIETIAADFASLRQVKAMADEIITKFPNLHVLVNNAGFISLEHLTTEDGYEMNFQINHLASFLLTNLLLGLLKKSAPARIVTVASDAHAMCDLDFDNLQAEKNFSWLNSYGLAKLGSVYMTYELAERLQGSGVVANCLHPGNVDTKMQRATSTDQGVSTAIGAATQVYLASAPEAAAINGRFFIDLQDTPTCDLAYDVENRRKFWKVSEELVKDYLV